MCVFLRQQSVMLQPYICQMFARPRQTCPSMYAGENMVVLVYLTVNIQYLVSGYGRKSCTDKYNPLIT